jgi:PIN domain nuclease of toxin-antitoxin system
MRYLLDTHLLLWGILDNPAFSAPLREILDESSESPLFSPVSVWEVATKNRTKHPLGISAEDFLQECFALGCDELPLHSWHATAIESLPPLHKDPFDRILLAQAIAENCTLLTHDSSLAAYGSPVLPV